MMDCGDIRDWLRRDLDGAAEPSSEAAEHLEACPACKSEAGRYKAIAEASRAALPPAAVPFDFVDRVMHTLVKPMGDERLAEVMRPRWASRLLFVPFVAALVVAAVTLWPKPEVAGAVLDTGASGSSGALAFTALEPSLFSADAKKLHAGVMHFACEEPTTVRTPLGEVHLRAGTTCVIRVTKSEEIEHMKLGDLKRIVPAFLAVTVFTGSCRVSNAQGVEEVEEQKTVEVTKGNPPRVNEAAVMRELDNIAKALDVITKRFERLSKAMVKRPRAKGGDTNVTDTSEEKTLEEIHRIYTMRLNRIRDVVVEARRDSKRDALAQQLADYERLFKHMVSLDQRSGKVDANLRRNFERGLKEIEQRAKQLAPLKARLEDSERLMKQLMAERDKNAQLASQIRALKYQLDASKRGKGPKWTWAFRELQQFQRQLKVTKASRAEAKRDGTPTAEWDRVISDLERKLGGLPAKPPIKKKK